MADVTCAHCNVRIGDHSTMVERDGQTFCCNNCALMGAGHPPAKGGDTTCAQCKVPIVDTSTQDERTGRTYCCPNCAAAMIQAAGRHAG